MQKWIVFEKEQVVEGFKKFVEKAVESYDGSYYLSLERLIEDYAGSLADEHDGHPMVLQGKGNSVESLEDFLAKAFEEEEENYQSWFNEVMSKHVDEERARKIIREQLEDPEYWLSPEYDFETAIAISEGLKECKEGFRYDLPEEVVEELRELFGLVDEGQEEEFLDVIFEELFSLKEELLKKHDTEAILSMDYWQISLTFPKKELSFGYVYDKEKVVSGLLEYMKENGDFFRVLDLENYKSEREELMQELYVQALSNPGVRKFIEEFSETVLLHLRSWKERLKQGEEESLAP